MDKKHEKDWSLLTHALQGKRGPEQQRIAAEALDFACTLLRKNSDYGGSAWREPVLAPDLDPGTAILVRMSDKIERIRTLATSEAQVTCESLQDTMRDLGAYALLWLARPQRTSTE